MSRHCTEFQISDLAAWTAVADLEHLIKKHGTVCLALAWGDYNVVDGKAPPYQAHLGAATDLENASRAFGLSASYDFQGILLQRTAFFTPKKSAPGTVKLIGIKESVDLGQRNWFHTISEVHDFRNRKTRLEKDTLGLGKIRLSHVKIASLMKDDLCQQLRQWGNEIEVGNTDNTNYKRATAWVGLVATGYADEQVRQAFIGVRHRLETAQTREEFSKAAIEFASAISAYQATEKQRSTEELAKAMQELAPTGADINRLRRIFPESLEYTASSDSVEVICKQILGIKKVAVDEWLLKKPIQQAYMSTGMVHPDPEIKLITDLAFYADFATRRGLEGEPATALAKALFVRLIEPRL